MVFNYFTVSCGCFVNAINSGFINISQHWTMIENYFFRLSGEEKPQEELDWYSKYLQDIKDILMIKI